MTTPSEAADPARPVLRVISGGEPTDDELAALVAVLAVRTAATSDADDKDLRRPLSAWVASGLIKGTRTKA